MANTVQKTEQKTETFAMLVINDPIPIQPQLTCSFNFQVNILKANSASHENSEVIIDCGASNHFCPDQSKFVTYHWIPPEQIEVADGRSFSVLGKGDVEVLVPNGDHRNMKLLLRNTLYAPNLTYTLLSVPMTALGSILKLEGENVKSWPGIKP